MTKNEVTSIQVFKRDAEKIKELASVVKKDMGSFVSQRMALMMAVNHLLKSYEDKTK